MKCAEDSLKEYMWETVLRRICRRLSHEFARDSVRDVLKRFSKERVKKILVNNISMYAEDPCKENIHEFSSEKHSKGFLHEAKQCDFKAIAYFNFSWIYLLCC